MENNVIRKFGVNKTAKTAKIILILFGCLVTFGGALLLALEEEQQMLGIIFIVFGVIGVTGAQFLSKRYICICESKLYGELGSFTNKNQAVEINYSEII